MLVSEVKEKYPLHFLVWNNEFQELETLLKENKVGCFCKRAKIFLQFNNLISRD